MHVDAPTLFLLPGFHGSAQLFEPLCAEFEGHLLARPLQFESFDTIQAHVTDIDKALPNTDIFLLAESFSGLIALSLAAKSPLRFSGVILSCCFARTPMKLLATLGARLPQKVYSASIFRSWILDHYCLNGVADPRLKKQILEAINQVAPSVVRRRLRVLAETNLTELLAHISTPVLVLSASYDRVVSSRFTRELRNKLPNARHKEIAGPHLILQAAPNQAATEIMNFIASCKN
ncbi:MAG: alpha/beta fold hydrolase [Pseudomonadota bacterium]